MTKATKIQKTSASEGIRVSELKTWHKQTKECMQVQFIVYIPTLHEKSWFLYIVKLSAKSRQGELACQVHWVKILSEEVQVLSGSN